MDMSVPTGHVLPSGAPLLCNCWQCQWASFRILWTALNCLLHPVFPVKNKSWNLSKKRHRTPKWENSLVDKNQQTHHGYFLPPSGDLYFLGVGKGVWGLDPSPHNAHGSPSQSAFLISVRTRGGLCNSLSQPRKAPKSQHWGPDRSTSSWPGSCQQQKTLLGPLLSLPADVTAAWPQVTKRAPLILALKP